MEIVTLLWLPANEDKLRQHGITRDEVESMIARDEWAAMAHPAHSDQTRVIGPTRVGRLITIVMEPLEGYGHWRPVTGWQSTADETAYYWEEYR